MYLYGSYKNIDSKKTLDQKILDRVASRLIFPSSISKKLICTYYGSYKNIDSRPL